METVPMEGSKTPAQVWLGRVSPHCALSLQNRVTGTPHRAAGEAFSLSAAKEQYHAPPVLSLPDGAELGPWLSRLCSRWPSLPSSIHGRYRLAAPDKKPI